MSHSIPANDNLTQVDLDTGLFQSIKTTDSALMEQLKLATSLPPEESAKLNRRGIPYLGGWLAGQHQHHGKVYVYGSRGLLVVDGTEVPPLVKYPLLPVKLTSNQSFRQLNEAKSVVVPASFSFDEFRQWTQTDNPYLLARVLEGAGKQPLANPDEWIPSLLSFTSHPHKRVRTTALNALKPMDSPVILEAFKKLVDDPDLAIRFLATIEVTRRDKPLALERYADYFRWNAPFLPVGADRFEYLPPDAVYEALLPHLNPEILRLFLAFPLIHPRSQSSNVLEKLSQRIFKDEALREVLLNPTCPLVLATPGELPRSKNYTTFVYKIVRPWGADAIPLLQKKLVSPNPSVRSLAMSLLLKFNDFLSNMGKGEIPIPSRDIGKALTREIDVAIFELRRTQFRSSPILIHFLANVRPFQNKFDEESPVFLQPTTYREWEFFEDLGDNWPQADFCCPQSAKPQESQFTKLDSRIVYSFYSDLFQSLSPDWSKIFEDRAFLKLLSQADRKSPTYKQYVT
ncbi:MAG TPA: HEAT repeat domain-containing protein, partial [Acidobacteriota bacterium]|nr:HEAT repeat domain-containing protein [Acidobacteriota bacterium]